MLYLPASVEQLFSLHLILQSLPSLRRGTYHVDNDVFVFRFSNDKWFRYQQWALKCIDLNVMYYCLLHWINYKSQGVFLSICFSEIIVSKYGKLLQINSLSFPCFTSSNTAKTSGSILSCSSFWFRKKIIFSALSNLTAIYKRTLRNHRISLLIESWADLLYIA